MKEIIALALVSLFLFGCVQQPENQKPTVIPSPSPTASPSPSTPALDSVETEKELEALENQLAEIEKDLANSEEIEITEIEESTLK